MRPITGFNTIKEYLLQVEQSKVHGLRLLFFRTSSRIDQLIAVAKKKSIKTERVDKEVFNQFGAFKDHRGVVLLISSLEQKNNFSQLKEIIPEFPAQAVVLILDQIVDPHNFGAIIRSSCLFSVDAIVVSQRNAAPLSSAARRSAAGGENYLPICQEKNLINAIDLLKKNDFWCYAARAEGESLNQVAFSRRVALVVGNEGRGIRPLVENRCDYSIAIETNRRIDSLNVSVAAGIILHKIACRLPL